MMIHSWLFVGAILALMLMPVFLFMVKKYWGHKKWSRLFVGENDFKT